MSNITDTNDGLVLPNEVTIRAATDADRAELERLAELDSTRPPAGPTLVAEVGDEFRAAYSITERRAIGDPFRRTAELVELLATLAKQLNGGRRLRRRRGATAPQPPGLGLRFPPPKLDRRAA